MPLTTSSIKASLQLDHFFTWCTIVKISKDRENKAAEKSIDAEVPNYGIPIEWKIWVSRHTDQVNLHPGHQLGVAGAGVGVVVFLWVHCVLFWQVVGLLVCSLPKCSAFSEQHILVRGKCGAIQGLVRESNSPSSGMRDHGQSPKFWPRGWKNMYHFAHQRSATCRWGDPFQTKDFCLVILYLCPQIILDCSFSRFSGICPIVG